MIVETIWMAQPGEYFFLSTKSAAGTWEDHCFSRKEFRKLNKFIRDYEERDIYFCPHGFSARRRTKNHAVLPKLLYSDMDEADPRKVKIKPTIAIESSPGRFVGIWMVDKPIVEQDNKSLSYYIDDADKGGWDLTQVLRVPDTYNYKYPNTPKVRTLWIDGPSYKLDDLRAKFPKVEKISRDDETDASAVFKEWSRKMAGWARRAVIADKATQGKRSEMMWKLESHFVEIGMDADEIFAVLRPCVWNKFKGRDEQLRRDIDKIINRKLHGNVEEKEEFDQSEGYKFAAQSMEDVPEEDIKWIWYPYLARKEVTLIEGDPGTNKSYIAMMISKAVVDGEKLPYQRQGTLATRGNVLYFDSENSASSVTKKRLSENGCKNMHRYFQEEKAFSVLDEDAMEKVYEACDRIKPAVIIFDPLANYIGGADMFRSNDVGEMMDVFRRLARRYNAAVLLIRHLTKDSKRDVMYRGQGSMSFVGAARSASTVMSIPDGDHPGERVLSCFKLNIAPVPPGIRFHLKPLPDTLTKRDRALFVWGEREPRSARELAALMNEPLSDKEFKDAHAWLARVLDEKPIEEAKLKRMSAAEGFTDKTFRRLTQFVEVIDRDGKKMWKLTNATVVNLDERRRSRQ